MVVGAFVLCLSNPAFAQPQPSQTTADDEARRIVAATVDGEPIRLGEIQRELAKVLGGRPIEPDTLRHLQAQTLRQLIGRRLILGYLQRKKLAASRQDVDLEMARIVRQLQQQNLTLTQYLERARIDQDDLRLAVQWQLNWKRYLDRYLTDENLQRHFEKHRRQFDGTQLHVAHILLKVESADDAAAVQRVVEEAERVRAEITSGKTTFADAAKSLSVAPTADQGGDIDLIARHQPMGAVFSVAAFALEIGDVSPPVVTPFGVHLILCLDVNPGERTWQDVRGPLSNAVTRYLFDWVADQQRLTATIKFTGAAPHFVPGADVLAD